MPQKVFQSSFNTGVISEEAQAQVKLARYQSACRRAENVIIQPVGGAERRGGFRKLEKVKDSANPPVLIPFDGGSSLRYMLEFGDTYLRFLENGSYAKTGSGSNIVTNPAFAAGITGWTNKSIGAGAFVWHSVQGKAQLTAPGASDSGWMEQALTVTASTTYELTVDIANNPTGLFNIRVGTATGLEDVLTAAVGSGSHVLTFTVPAATTTVYLGMIQAFNTDNLAESESIANGLFVTNLNNWTTSLAGGTITWDASQSAKFSGDISQLQSLYQAIPTVVGETYQVEYIIGGDTLGVKVGTSALASDVASFSDGPGTHTREFTATSTTTYLTFDHRGIYSGLDSHSFLFVVSVLQKNVGSWVDNVSVKVAGTPYEIASPFALSDLTGMQFVQLESSMLLVSGDAQLTFLIPIASTSWTIAQVNYTKEDEIAGATGTNLGNMTAGGGLAAAFDDDTYKTAAQCAGGAAGTFTTTIGKDWGASVTKVLKGVVIWSSTDQGFFTASEDPEIVFKVQASTDNFSSSIVDLAEFKHQDDSTKLVKLEIFNLNDTGTEYRYHRVQQFTKSDNGAGANVIGGVEFYEETAENPPGLNVAGAYAPAIGKYNQRVVTGGQNGKPNTVYGTKTGETLVMGLGDASDSDAFEHELDQTSAIKWLLDSDGLMVGTSEGVVRMYGTQGPLTPSDKQADADVSIGAAASMPIKIGNAAMYIQSDRKRVQEVRIPDNGVKLEASDMMSVAEHIGSESPLQGLAAQNDPIKIAWTWRQDGLMAGMTYDRAEALFAWHTHPMDNGSVMWMSQLKNSSDQTEIYAVIKRTVGGADYTTIEVMDSTVYHDGAVKYSGVAATTITGLDHLEGLTVSVWGDGYYRGTFTVTNGQIDLPSTDPMSEGDVGLNFVPLVEPVTPIRGTGQKRRFGPSKVKIENTSSLWVNGKNVPLRTGSDKMGVGKTFTGWKKMVILGWKEEPTITFEGREPGPFKVLSYSGTMEFGQ